MSAPPERPERDHPSINSRADRLDHGGEVRRQADELGLLANPPWSWFLRALGVGAAELDDARVLLKQGARLLGNLDTIADTLAPFGWIVFELSPADDYGEAAHLIAVDRVEEAEDIIVRSWNRIDAMMLHTSAHRVVSLYRDRDRDAPRGSEIGDARGRLIHEAVENHREGRYASAITMALTQIDGIVADFSEEGAVFFSRQRNSLAPRATLTDDQTLAGHPAALAALATLMTEICPTTETSGRLLRHGILHGRELEYGTLRHSTQILATLLAVITWAQPIARARLDAFTAAHEARYEGSSERDEDGRLLDRRGFAAAKAAASSLAALQDRFYEDHGRYAESAREIDPRGVLANMFTGASTSCSTDGHIYVAWARATTGYVFAVSGHNGEQTCWQFAGQEPPAEGVGSDDDWRGVLDPSHPDW